MGKSKIDLARDAQAPNAGSCIVLGEGAAVRIAFVDDTDPSNPVLLSAVTLTRGQMVSFAGMVGAVLDSDDPHAVSVN